METYPLIYICHYKKNNTRFEYLTKTYQNLKFITDFDREEIAGYLDFPQTEDNKKRQHHILEKILPTLMFNEIFSNAVREGRYISPQHEYAVISEEIKNLEENNIRLANKVLNLSEKSIFLKHLVAFQLLVASGETWGVIAEDDIIFKENSIERLSDLIDELPDSVDFIDIGGGVNLKAQYAFNKLPYFKENLYLIDPPSTRTVCAYIINRSFAQRILNLQEHPVIMIDFYIAFALQEFGSKVFWVEDPIFVHGSEQGFYSSTIR